MVVINQHLLPSIARTADCGYRYVVVIGFDEGDPFYDSLEGVREIKDWFQVSEQHMHPSFIMGEKGRKGGPHNGGSISRRRLSRGWPMPICISSSRWCPLRMR